MRIREADPPGDALLLKGSEGRGEAVAALPFPGAGRGNVPPPFAPVQRPVPLPGAAVAAAAQGPLALWKPHREEHAMSWCVQGLVEWKREVTGQGKSGNSTRGCGKCAWGQSVVQREIQR